MNSTKSRVRSNATQMIEATSQAALINNMTNTSSVLQSQQHAPSLLKIESVVPTRLNATRNIQRNNRLMTRSYSTLCGPTPISNIVATPIPVAAAYANGLVNYKNVTRKINTNINHRQKNNGQHQQQFLMQNERHESPTNKLNGQQAIEVTNIIVENGVHKVRRTAREREKQPDRINLDRRGLCTIPIIDNEPSLRLLSLQHNLINTFHIPDCEISLESSSVDSVKDNNNNSISSPNTTTSITNAKQLLRQKSRNQINLNFSANNNATMNVNGASVTNGSIAPTTTSFLQKSFMFQNKNGILKRANSVMINYSPTQTSSNANQQSSIFCQKARLIATPSINLTDSSLNQETITNNNSVICKSPPELQIDANNSYMNSFRFNLSNLVFLDLYNNQIEKISNLDGLKSLTVLLLGKNRISDITGIVSLKQTLRVLDLHGNRITHITQKICQLQELKSLNLAGNLLRQIQANDFAGLCCLRELNLKRNRIKKINVSDDLHNLERLWLCHNELQAIEDMSSIAKSINLKEITIENNPISLAGDCVSFLVSYLPLLVSLNQLQITEQVRRAAHAWRKSKETSDQNYKHLSSDVNSNIRREEIISNARTNWELIRSQQASIINGNQRQNNQMKKNIKSKILMSNNSSSSISTGSFSSNANFESSNNIVDEQSINVNNTKIMKSVIDVPKRQIAKLLRSTSHDNTSSITSDRDVDADYILPPMINQLVQMERNYDSKRSASSTRPQIDSASESDFAADSDELKNFKSRVPTTPPIANPKVNSIPSSPIEIIVGPNDNEISNDEKNYTSQLPPITISNLNNNIDVNSESVAAMNIKEHFVDDLTSKEFQNNNKLNINTTTYNNIKETIRSPSPINNKEQRATLTIIDIDNSSGISLQPTSKLDVESCNKAKIESVDTDKLSIISKVSSKTNDSVNNATVISFTNEEQQQQTQQRQVHSSQNNHHSRNRSGTRKIGPPLVRSQTAKNLSSHLNQNQTPGIGNQQGVVQKKETKKEIDKDREQGNKKIF
ncbi:hypothetical protein PVAND_011755 [Polypedilum vanderplanki]|uniref:Dynein axonemal assembly factor 1 homolog n=1 Tax=Polypedilum vanderplanki TaxID=319348 RepID=A0A9J6CJL8_POLVA|nr:hypothetical protein PVAND_011755 [Polypedilum vanderplanki]